MKILTAQVHPSLRRAYEAHQAEHPVFTHDGAARFVRRVLDEQLIPEAIGHELRTINADNLHESPFWTSRGMVLVASPELVLAIDKVPVAPAATLASISQDAVVATLDEGVVLERFAIPRDIRLDVLDRSARLVPAGSTTLRPGEPVAIHAATDVCDFHTPHHDRFLVKAMSPVRIDFTWSFDRDSLLAWNISGANQIDDQVLTALEALACLGGPAHADTAAGFLSARSHHVRWKALHVLHALAPERASAAIEPFLDDPHPHVRAAALKAVE